MLLFLRRHGRSIGWIIILGVCFSWFTFYNRWPLVYTDTASYLLTAIKLKVVPERAIGYGLWLRLFWITGVPWLVTIAQGVLTAGGLWLVGSTLNVPRAPKIGIILFVALLTPATFYVSWLMADIFTAILVLSLATFIVGFDRLSTGYRWLLAFLILLAALMHLANLLIALTICGIVGLASLVSTNARGWRRPTGLIALALICTPLPAQSFISFLVNPNDSTHVSAATTFLLARLVNDQTAVRYLTSSCPTHPWSLCPFLPKLTGLSSNDFLWRNDGPVRSLNGWLQTPADFNQIILNTFRLEPGRNLTLALQNTSRQLFRVSTHDILIQYDASQPVYSVIHNNLPDSQARAFDRSRQELGQLMTLPVPIDRWFTIIDYIGLIAPLIVMVWARKNSTVFGALLITWSALIVNAFVMANASGTFDRYQGRIAWVTIPICLFALASHPPHEKVD